MSAISCQQRQFGTLETGQAITCYSLRNTSGMTVNLLNYGAILNSVQLPNIRGEMHEITLGPSQLIDLTNQTFHSGCTLSHLPKRYGINLNQIGKTLWEAESTTQDNLASVKLTTQGTIELKYSFTQLQYQLTIEYTLTATDELIIRSTIQTSLGLPLFITHHPCWNLMGDSQKEVSDHILQVWASQYTELDTLGFAKFPLLDIQDKPAFNFQQPQRIAEQGLPDTSEQTPYNVCFKLTPKEGIEDSYASMPLAARVKAPVSGRTLEVYTSQPALHFYLPSNAKNNSNGLCLSPMPLLEAESTPESSNILQQETCYKLIW